MMSKTKDEFLIKEFNKAINKVKSVLRNDEKIKSAFLVSRTEIGGNWKNKKTINSLSVIQSALTNFYVL